MASWWHPCPWLVASLGLEGASMLVASLSLAGGLEGASVASWWHPWPLDWFMWLVQLIGSMVQLVGSSVGPFGWFSWLVHLVGPSGRFI